MKKNNAKFRWTFTGILFAIGCISLGSAAYLVENETNLGLSDGLVQVRFVNDTNATTNEMLVPPGTIVKVNTSTVPGYSYVSSNEGTEVENKVIFGDFVVPEDVDEIKCTAFAPIVDSDSYVSLSEYVQGGTPAHLAVNLTGGTTTLESTLFSPSTEERRGLNEKYVFLDVEDNFVLSKPLSFVIGGEPSTDTNQRNLNQGAAPATTNAFQHVTEANHLITVVMQSDLTIGSGGSLALEATTGRKSTGFSGNVISGSYTALDLNGHTITLQNGATLRQFGLLTDSSYDKSGQIIVDNGAHLSGGLVVEDFNGGTVTVGSYLVNSAPFFLFSMPYLEATVDVLYGGNFGGDVSLYAQGNYGSTEIPLFGSSDLHMVEIENASSHVVRSVKGRHEIDSNYSTSEYEYWVSYIHDYREEFALIGPGGSTTESFRVNPMILPLNMASGSISVNAEVSFMAMDFPIAPWMHISLEDGAAINFGNSFGFLPGSTLTADETTKVIFSSRSGKANITPQISGSDIGAVQKTMELSGLPYLKSYDYCPPQSGYSSYYFPSFSSNFSTWDSILDTPYFSLDCAMELDSASMPSSFGIGGDTHLGENARAFLAGEGNSRFISTPVGIMRRGQLELKDLMNWIMPFSEFNGYTPQVAANVMYSCVPLSVDGYMVRDLSTLDDDLTVTYNPTEKWVYDTNDSLAKLYSAGSLTRVAFYKFNDDYDTNLGGNWLSSPNGNWVEASRLSDGSWGELSVPNYQSSIDGEIGATVLPFVKEGNTSNYFARFGGCFVQMLNLIESSFTFAYSRYRTHTQEYVYEYEFPFGSFDWRNDSYSIDDFLSTSLQCFINGITSIDTLVSTAGNLTSDPVFSGNQKLSNLNISRFRVMNRHNNNSDGNNNGNAPDSVNTNLITNLDNGFSYSAFNSLRSWGYVTAAPSASRPGLTDSGWSNYSCANYWEEEDDGIITGDASDTRSHYDVSTYSVNGSSTALMPYGFFVFDMTRAAWRLLATSTIR